VCNNQGIPIFNYESSTEHCNPCSDTEFKVNNKAHLFIKATDPCIVGLPSVVHPVQPASHHQMQL